MKTIKNLYYQYKEIIMYLIFGVLTNYSVDGGKLSLEITGKEKIVGTYYFETKSEKKNFINNVEIGDKLKIIGNLKLPSQK